MGHVLRWTTAGESHGRALVAVVEGMIAGIHVTTVDIAAQLARRSLRYARVAAGRLARGFLREALGVEVVSHVIPIGAAKAYDGRPPHFADLAAIDARPVRAFDKDGEARMIAEIEDAKKDGDPLVGVVEV